MLVKSGMSATTSTKEGEVGEINWISKLTSVKSTEPVNAIFKTTKYFVDACNDKTSLNTYPPN